MLARAFACRRLSSFSPVFVVCRNTAGTRTGPVWWSAGLGPPIGHRFPEWLFELHRRPHRVARHPNLRAIVLIPNPSARYKRWISAQAFTSNNLSHPSDRNPARIQHPHCP